MAGKLLQVDTTTITSATASFSIGGIDDDSVYMVTCNSVNVQNQNEDVFIRIGTSSSADTSNNYDYIAKNLYTGGNFIDNQSVNNTSWVNVFINQRTAGIGSGNAVMYLHNFYNTNVPSTIIFDNVHTYTGGNNIYGVQGVGHHTQGAQQTHIYFGYGGNIINGTFTLYKIL